MPRRPRVILPQQPHHVTQRGNNKGLLFKDKEDLHVFFETLVMAVHRNKCQVHAYVFMSNHIHLLVTPESPEGLSDAMRLLGTHYVRYFNRRYSRTGTLYEGRFRSTVVNSERYLVTCYRYIEENPVRASLVSDPADYTWSSYHANALGASDVLVTPHDRYLALGATPESRRSFYRSLFRTELEIGALTAMRFSTRVQPALRQQPFRGGIPANALNANSALAVAL